ncbi:hypothetical protein CXG81DRAFT_26859 [Caulochytrium protostelioides]|uniref:Uncharacterized protein n=1 Tax=Caulochytrium protostelioides TaxID=1555241 RepID=A0A4P9X5L0_9FUNG|nr:hypothetical protein CXG81DRAFT_26859 [Caulochytrium protostelioides]|eukprot:RKP00427.1 hypothetical protein CXG81DRAFT_26859 [Caulochytrium protostelioides]
MATETTVDSRLVVEPSPSAFLEAANSVDGVLAEDLSEPSRSGTLARVLGGGVVVAAVTQIVTTFIKTFRDWLVHKSQHASTGAGGSETGGFSWQSLGALSGFAIGFIVHNVPGCFIGTLAGQRLGAIRDEKGVSFWSGLSKLPWAALALVAEAVLTERGLDFRTLLLAFLGESSAIVGPLKQ